MYHGTSEEAWKLIQKEGVLHGVRSPEIQKAYPNASRVTYLAVHAQEAAMYGDVVLEIDCGFAPANEEVWQIRVYEPIPLHIIRRLSPEECAPLFEERGRIRAKQKD